MLLSSSDVHMCSYNELFARWWALLIRVEKEICVRDYTYILSQLLLICIDELNNSLLLLRKLSNIKAG